MFTSDCFSTKQKRQTAQTNHSASVSGSIATSRIGTFQRPFWSHSHQWCCRTLCARVCACQSLSNLFERKLHHQLEVAELLPFCVCRWWFHTVTSSCGKTEPSEMYESRKWEEIELCVWRRTAKAITFNVLLLASVGRKEYRERSIVRVGVGEEQARRLFGRFRMSRGISTEPQ